ncbi:hypothetical protein CTEN210_08604 [Chaetoceros tenuissimus]|uniref:TRAF3-interacting protein 1 N-terminal domain-containing protein n=1 Tax=Chaetoceros tenuissimus TaxID=426638 RepID=A0AAD3H6T6_9STRA|nr:hypothetical protein CTEN210_08604 [Chaetoceros tenuissimus]
MNKTLKKAIHQTTESITESFAKIETSGNHKSTHFVSPKCMVKPPFEFIHALVTIYYRHCNFAKDVYRDSDLDLQNMNSRKVRIKFLFQIIVYVGKILGEPLDVLLSPAKILGGKDVIKTLHFLEKLAKSVSLEKDVRDNMIPDLAQENKIDLLYRKAVKTRLALEKFIKVVREKMRIKDPVIEKRKQNKKISKIHPTTVASKGKDYQRAACPKKQQIQQINDCNDDNSAHKRSKPLHIKKQEQVHMPTKKSKIEKYVLQKESGAVTPKSNERLYKNSTDLDESSSIAQNPFEEENRKTKKSKVKKFRVEKGVIIPSLLEIEEEITDSDREEEVKIKTLQQIEEEYRRRMQRLKEKEAKLENRIQDTKSKEEHLQINEERVKRLAENLRKQHDKLKQDGLRQAMELDKLRLETTNTSRAKETKELQPVDVSFEFDFDDEFMKKACNTPTITDLRLVLEKRERMLSKRHDRMARAEKDLHRQLKELEELKRSTLEEKESSRHSESKQIRQRQFMKNPKKETSDNKGRKVSAKSRNISSNKEDCDRVQEKSFSPSRECDTCCHQRSDPRVPYTISVPPQPHIKKNKELTTITEEDESTTNNIRASRKSIPRSLLLYKQQQTHQHQENFVSLVHA